MPKIFVKGSSKAIEYLPGQNLLQILHDNDIFIENPCNGKGSCGKCKVKITNKHPLDKSLKQKYMSLNNKLSMSI